MSQSTANIRADIKAALQKLTLESKPPLFRDVQTYAPSKLIINKFENLQDINFEQFDVGDLAFGVAESIIEYTNKNKAERELSQIASEHNYHLTEINNDNQFHTVLMNLGLGIHHMKIPKDFLDFFTANYQGLKDFSKRIIKVGIPGYSERDVNYGNLVNKSLRAGLKNAILPQSVTSKATSQDVSLALKTLLNSGPILKGAMEEFRDILGEKFPLISWNDLVQAAIKVENAEPDFIAKNCPVQLTGFWEAYEKLPYNQKPKAGPSNRNEAAARFLALKSSDPNIKTAADVNPASASTTPAAVSSTPAPTTSAQTHSTSTSVAATPVDVKTKVEDQDVKGLQDVKSVFDSSASSTATAVSSSVSNVPAAPGGPSAPSSDSINTANTTSTMYTAAPVTFSSQASSTAAAASEDSYTSYVRSTDEEIAAQNQIEYKKEAEELWADIVEAVRTGKTTKHYLRTRVPGETLTLDMQISLSIAKYESYTPLTTDKAKELLNTLASSPDLKDPKLFFTVASGLGHAIGMYGEGMEYAHKNRLIIPTQAAGIKPSNPPK